MDILFKNADINKIYKECKLLCNTVTSLIDLPQQSTNKSKLITDMTFHLIYYKNNGIMPIEFIRVYENDILVNCYTNDGNVLSSEQISKEVCQSIINSSDNYTILFEFGKNEVIIGANNTVISSNKLINVIPLLML